MKRLLFVLSIAAMLGTLWGSVRPAHSGGCTDINTYSLINTTDVIAVGTLTALFAPGPERGPEDIGGRISVERYLKGSGPTDIIVVDDRHTTADLSEFMPGGEDVFLAAMEEVTGPGVLPSAGGVPPGGDGFPYLPVAALAVFGPVGFLVAAAFVWRRSV